MQLQSINNNLQSKNQNPRFKSAYPVYHWVAEKSGGSYAPAVTHDLNKKLQGIIVRLFNRTSKLSTTEFGKLMIEKLKPRKTDGVGDKDYRSNPIVRTFSDKNGGWDKKFIPINYIISGNNVSEFNKKYAEPIGKNSAISPRINGIPSSAEYRSALRDYVLGGLNYVRKPELQIKDQDEMVYGLHTKFEVVRNKNGKIKGYELVDIKFCPETGSENPFIRTGYYTE